MTGTLLFLLVWLPSLPASLAIAAYVSIEFSWSALARAAGRAFGWYPPACGCDAKHPDIAVLVSSPSMAPRSADHRATPQRHVGASCAPVYALYMCSDHMHRVALAP